MPRLELPELRWVCSLFAALLLAGLCHAQAPAANSPMELLDHLQGRWVLQGTIGGKPTTHDVQADWVLKQEYMRIHEVSREKDAKGDPVYEAIVFVGWDVKAIEYVCLWLDSTAGSGLSAKGIAHGKQSGDSIPFLFALSPSDTIRNTFVYQRNSDSWKWLIDEETNGKTERFADVTLSRAK